MRYSDLAGKEIIDIDQGIRLGVINDTDLVLDTESGKVAAIIIPSRGGWWQRRELEIPWHGIRKIGVDLIIVDLSTAVDWHGRERTGGALAARGRAVWDAPSEPDDG
ncbi:MAG: YlmC/YmxH family sporulation protein [Firmicutes bacterium]|nr:YlmC/YmxH family sporulation protein [Bacillota bacterium]